MDIQISRREVLNNIARLKEKVSEQSSSRQGKLGPRFYRALLNKKNGDLQFVDSSSSHPSGEWKEIHLDVESSENRPASFVARDEKNLEVKPMGLEPLAWRILAETVETLNLMASQHEPLKSSSLPEKELLENISEITISDLGTSLQHMSAWKGDIDRIKAEKLLKTQTPGTYILRHAGKMAQTLADNLSITNQTEVKAYLITLREFDKKISEKLILETGKGWTVYQDNPDLSDSDYVYYASPEEVLKDLIPLAKYPLKD